MPGRRTGQGSIRLSAANSGPSGYGHNADEHQHRRQMSAQIEEGNVEGVEELQNKGG